MYSATGTTCTCTYLCIDLPHYTDVIMYAVSPLTTYCSCIKLEKVLRLSSLTAVVWRHPVDQMVDRTSGG